MPGRSIVRSRQAVVPTALLVVLPISLLWSCGDDQPVLSPIPADDPTGSTVVAPEDTTTVMTPPDTVVGKPPDTLAKLDSSGVCTTLCDARPAGIPTIVGEWATGDITTYGSVTAKEPTWGGACLYGNTDIRHYAAIQVNQMPGDAMGQWQGGRICGQCLEIKVQTSDGWKTTVVRITDKCPDGNCGVDLGGAPASDVMGSKPGRYKGEWKYVTCEGQFDVSDGPSAIYVKEGSGSWWSGIHVQNGPASVLDMRVRRIEDGPSGKAFSLSWATQMENYFMVPKEVLQDSSAYDVEVDFWGGVSQVARVRGSDLAKERAVIPLRSRP